MNHMTRENIRMQQSGHPTRSTLRAALGLVLAVLGSAALAQTPALFTLNYDARYGSWTAQSVRSLTQEEAAGVYHLQAQSKVVLLGQSVSTITEDSIFTLEGGLPQTRSYSFRQTGIGARARSVEFDRSAGLARYRVKDKLGEVALQGPVYDELTTFLVLRQHLERGETDIVFDVLDRDHIETHHYRVVSDDTLPTALGDFAAVHVERVRDEGNRRRTEFWLAREHDYVLLKLEQSEPDGSDIGLDINGGVVNGQPLLPRQESPMNELEHSNDTSSAP